MKIIRLVLFLIIIFLFNCEPQNIIYSMLKSRQWGFRDSNSYYVELTKVQKKNIPSWCINDDGINFYDREDLIRWNLQPKKFFPGMAQIKKAEIKHSGSLYAMDVMILSVVPYHTIK